LVIAIATLSTVDFAIASASADGNRVTITLDPSVSDGPITGRLFFMVSQNPDLEPREVAPMNYVYYLNMPGMAQVPLFGRDVEGMEPGATAVIDDTHPGFPFPTLADLPPGEYFAQALLHIYTRFDRADGHTIWAPMDRGEGQQHGLAPGNLYSEVASITIRKDSSLDLALTLNQVLPDIPLRPDSKFTKRFQMRSEIMSEFWGRDIHMGAEVLLPKGYDEHPDVHYPVLYHHGHFMEGPLHLDDAPPTPGPKATPAERFAHDFARNRFRPWLDADLPRFIVVALRHPTPYFDDSYAINTAANGPWGDAVMDELIPEIESRFRIIREPYARVMTGGSTGGWIAAALQMYHPSFYGGAWSFCPDSVTFSAFLTVNLYEDENAFIVPGYEWKSPERSAVRSEQGQSRLSMREMGQLTRTLGSRGRAGEAMDGMNSLFSPLDTEGYPRRMWDPETGVIDKEVVAYWRDNDYDLLHYLRENWETIGTDLVGKLHFSCGDMDNFYLNLALYEMEEFLESTTEPYYDGWFKYGRPMVGHTMSGYQDPWPGELLKEMAEHITANAPAGTDCSVWKYE